MSKVDRASQFAPFSALKGFEEALRKREEIVVDKVELSAEKLEYLDYVLSMVANGQELKITYYSNGKYIVKQGMLSRVNKQARYLTIVTTDISFDDIRDIEVV